MKVLLVVTDLYRNIGGGQTIYRKIVEATPGVEFFYFRAHEAADTPRPANATPILRYGGRNLEMIIPPPFPSYRRNALEDADRVARSVAGQQFDIVDVPDFYVFGSLLRTAFEHHNVQVGRIVLAMHGNISASVEMQWGSAGNNVLEQRVLEREQFENADGVYGISPRYIKKWQAEVNRPVHYIDPIHFIDIPATAHLPAQNGQKPAIYCIGRMERRKGNDLCIELARWLKPDFYGQLCHVGDEDYSYLGIGSRYLLDNIAAARGMTLEFLPSLNRQQLMEIFCQRSVVVLPVRYDTLNLIALEALFCGCPVAVSSEAGVCDYLDEAFPSLPYIKIDFENFYASVPPLEALLTDYDTYRQRLADYLRDALPQRQNPLDMQGMYHAILQASRRETDLSQGNMTYIEKGLSYRKRIKEYLRNRLPVTLCKQSHYFLRHPRTVVRKKINDSRYRDNARFVSTLIDSVAVPHRLERIASHSEHSLKGLREKLDTIYGLASSPLYRCNFWLDIARIERILGHELMALTYELRILRLLGRDDFNLLPRVVASLRDQGFVHEADAAQAMYGDPARAAENVYAFLQEAHQRNLAKPELPFARIDDRRSNATPKVSVIVSLYNAAPKLRFFLTALMQQTLMQKPGQVEIILIDSGSPTDEYQVTKAFWRENPMNAVYARSAERETIQAAWNRGIRLARSPYLVFLGVDEALYPEALETLAGGLDAAPSVDWVMSSSLVTEVDPRGLHKNDVMTYKRGGAHKDLTYLETCYLSWVGGMYRKSIHDRFGYYDESFGAAGDTEFKNRILPYIEAKFLPQTLGLFLNYPEERTTASPRAEIEDLRAWYIHRTPGGIRYAFENRPVEDGEKLFCAALGYRKSYCGHISCDIEYAKYLASYLLSRSSQLPGLRKLSDGLGVMLAQLRALEFTFAPPRANQCVRTLARSWSMKKKIHGAHKALLPPDVMPTYDIFNDNRYEQHSWLWKSD